MSLAAELSAALDVEPKVTPGGRGQFDVVVDGELVFSKSAKRRFPNAGEVSEILR